jgi:hypothetical protein
MVGKKVPEVVARLLDTVKYVGMLACLPSHFAKAG